MNSLSDRSYGNWNIIKYLIFTMPKTAFTAIYIMLCCAIFKNEFTGIRLIVLSAGCMLFCGYDTFIGAIKAVKRKRFMHPDVYLSIATIGTLVIGMYYEAVLAAAVFAMCRSVINTLNEWMRHTYRTDVEDIIPLSSKKSNVENRLLNAVTLYLIISLFAIAALTIVIPVFWRVPFEAWLRRAFILFAAACPGALTMIADAEFYKCLNTARSAEIFFSSKSAVEEAAKVTSVAMGKTDASSEDGFKIESVEPSGISTEALLLLAAYACSFSQDERFTAIVRDSGVNVDVSKVDMYRNIGDMGTGVSINGVIVFAGTAELMRKCGIETVTSDNDDLYIHIAASNRYGGKIKLRKNESVMYNNAVNKLKAMDIDRVVMLTSDSKRDAERVASKLAINEVWSELTAKEQCEKLRNLCDMQLENENIAYVAGNFSEIDLMNEADVGISVGIIADDSADIKIPDGDYTKAASALALARAFSKNFGYDLKIACAFKAAAIILAVIGFASIWTVAVLDFIAAVFVVSDKNKTKYDT